MTDHIPDNKIDRLIREHPLLIIPFGIAGFFAFDLTVLYGLTTRILVCIFTGGKYCF